MPFNFDDQYCLGHDRASIFGKGAGDTPGFGLGNKSIGGNQGEEGNGEGNGQSQSDATRRAGFARGDASKGTIDGALDVR